MWERLLRFAQDTLRLKQKTEQNAADIERVIDRLDELAKAFEELRTEFRHHLDVERQERENLLLRLENSLLRFERRLPGGPAGEDRNLLK